MEPQFVIPPIEKADIKSTAETDQNDHTGDSQEPIEVILRDLIPKRKTKDPVLPEKVEYFENGKKKNTIHYPTSILSNTINKIKKQE